MVDLENLPWHTFGAIRGLKTAIRDKVDANRLDLLIESSRAAIRYLRRLPLDRAMITTHEQQWKMETHDYFFLRISHRFLRHITFRNDTRENRDE